MPEVVVNIPSQTELDDTLTPAEKSQLNQDYTRYLLQRLYPTTSLGPPWHGEKDLILVNNNVLSGKSSRLRNMLQ